MKLQLLWLFTAILVFGQGQDPFIPAVPDGEADETVYDFADVHKWDDQMVNLKDKLVKSPVEWISSHEASHRGVPGKTRVFEFRLNSEDYDSALKHPDQNRGVVLMSGDTRFPALYCWLRPLSRGDKTTNFHLSVPPEQLANTYVAFIPKDGKTRFLYNLAQVLQKITEKAEAEKK